MTASRRRTQIRQTQRDLRRQRCTCNAVIEPVTVAETSAVGAAFGADVTHRLGCALGDRAAQLNRRGVVPVLHFHADAELVEGMADEALASGTVVARGGYVVAPDLVVLEGVANGHEVPDSLRLRRADGRTASVFRDPREVTG